MEQISDLTRPSVLKELLGRYGFSFSKSLGQNFLTDAGVLQHNTDGAALNKTVNVLEIGPGAGTLTRCLATQAKKVVAVEIDNALIPVLQETLSPFPNAEIVHGDIMKTDIAALTQQQFGNEPFCVVANLPYYITTPVVMLLLEGGLPVTGLTLMVQKEVAARMLAKPGGKDYGALSIAVQYRSVPALVCMAEPHCFLPQPKVASAVIHLDIPDRPTITVENETFFFLLVKAAFGQRRKTLQNALCNSPFLKLSKDAVQSALSEMGLNADIRGEKLSIPQFAQLADLLQP